MTLIYALSWVMSIQTQIVNKLNTKLIMYNEKIKQSNLYLKQIEQIKNAPKVYLQALYETIRRDKFSSVYKKVFLLFHQYTLFNSYFNFLFFGF